MFAPSRKTLNQYMCDLGNRFRWRATVVAAYSAIKKSRLIGSPGTETARRNILLACQRALDQIEDADARRRYANFYGVSAAELREWIDAAERRIAAAKLRFSNIEAYQSAWEAGRMERERRLKAIDCIKRLRALRRREES